MSDERYTRIIVNFVCKGSLIGPYLLTSAIKVWSDQGVLGNRLLVFDHRRLLDSYLLD